MHRPLSVADARDVREELHYDGVRLAPLAPLAWAATFGLSFVVNALAESGMGVGNPRLQSVMLVTVFCGILAILGTVQKLNHFQERGRRIPAATMMIGFVLFAGAVMFYGVASYV